MAVSIVKDVDGFMVCVTVGTAEAGAAPSAQGLLQAAHHQIVNQMSVESRAAEADNQIAEIEACKTKCVKMPA